MNIEEFTSLLASPDKVNTPVQTHQLEEIIKDFPYFQAARALHLKGLKNLNSFKYNNALKATAAMTTDREVLFDFITSEEFLQNAIAQQISGQQPSLKDTEIEVEILEADQPPKTELIETDGDQPLPRNLEQADTILNPDLFKSKDPEIDKTIEQERAAKEVLEMGKPLEFSRNERHSFTQWLQITNLSKQEDSVEEKPQKETSETSTAERSRKFELIDKFIERNPKIVPDPEASPKINIKDSLKIDKNELMTETLARVYLEQKKYKEAIKAYKILSLKYPEKSSFFADRIRAVKRIQKEQDN